MTKGSLGCKARTPDQINSEKNTLKVSPDNTLQLVNGGIIRCGGHSKPFHRFNFDKQLQQDNTFSLHAGSDVRSHWVSTRVLDIKLLLSLSFSVPTLWPRQMAGW